MFTCVFSGMQTIYSNQYWGKGRKFQMTSSRFIVFAYIKPFIYSVTNSTGATQRFSANHKRSLEQRNQSLFVSDQSQMRNFRPRVCSPSMKRQLNIYFKAPRIYKTKTDPAQVHLPNDGLTENKTDWK